MSELAVWLNGSMSPGRGPHLRADDHGLLVGDGVFETLLVVDAPHDGRRQAFAVGRHLRRLRCSARIMRLDVRYSDDDLREAIEACLRAAPGAGIVRITVTSGAGPLRSSRGDTGGSTVVMAGDPPPAHRPAASIATVPFARNERGAAAGAKTISYAENVIALHHAVARGATEAIFGDTQGRVSDGTGSNIFWSDGERLHTSPLDTGALAGVTRELLLERLDVSETHLALKELHAVPEAFLASTTRCVQSIATIDEATLPVTDGPLTASASEAMANLIADEIDP